jgi:hypothetical protein
MELFRRKFLQRVRDDQDVSRRDAIERVVLVFAQKMLCEQSLLLLTPTRSRLRVMNIKEFVHNFMRRRCVLHSRLSAPIGQMPVRFPARLFERRHWINSWRA